MPSHPSTFWFPSTRLMLTVYVDDLMLGGPEAEHAPFWEKLMKRVKLDDPEPVTRFLGRYHELTEVTAPPVDIRDYFIPTVKNAITTEGAEEVCSP